MCISVNHQISGVGMESGSGEDVISPMDESTVVTMASSSGDDILLLMDENSGVSGSAEGRKGQSNGQESDVSNAGSGDVEIADTYSEQTTEEPLTSNITRFLNGKGHCFLKANRDVSGTKFFRLNLIKDSN